MHGVAVAAVGRVLNAVGGGAADHAASEGRAAPLAQAAHQLLPVRGCLCV